MEMQSPDIMRDIDDFAEDRSLNSAGLTPDKPMKQGIFFDATIIRK